MTPNFPDCLLTFQLPNAFNVYAVIVAESIAEIFNKILLFSFWLCPSESCFLLFQPCIIDKIIIIMYYNIACMIGRLAKPSHLTKGIEFI